MKRYPVLFIKWLATVLDIKLQKAAKGTTTEGDFELLRYILVLIQNYRTRTY
jgi:hypothetical protein